MSENGREQMRKKNNHPIIFLSAKNHERLMASEFRFGVDQFYIN
jgi:hypothetical protein